MAFTVTLEGRRPHIDVQMPFQGDLMFPSSVRGDGMIDQPMVSACFLQGFAGAWHCSE